MKKPIFKQLIEWIFSAVFIGVYFVLLFNAFPIVILITIYALSYEPKKTRKNSQKARRKYKKYPRRSYQGYKSPKRSKGENQMYEIVKNKFPSELVLRNERPSWLKNEKGNNLELDVYFPNLELAFEYHGRQHKEYTPFFHNSFKDFERQNRNDEIKIRKCKLRGITLIIIWFDDPLSKSFINKKINEKYISKKNVTSHNENNVIELKIETPTNISETTTNLPCLTCGFSKCNLEYHFGA